MPAFPPDQPGYQDLRSLLTFTIDDAETSDIDDALSLSEEDGRLLIGVHITDVGFFVPAAQSTGPPCSAAPRSIFPA